MSLDLIAKHKGNSDIADGMLEIIRQLGLWLEAITGVNPDAGYSSFSAANYNHGNRSEQADLIEEVILRLQEINAAGPGGGGGGEPSEDNKIRVDADDTVSKTFDELIDPLLNEISWGKSDGTEELGKQIILLAKLAFLAGQKAYVGGVSASNPAEHAKLNVLAEENQSVLALETFSGRKLVFNDKGYLIHTGGVFQVDISGNFVLRSGTTSILEGSPTKVASGAIKQTAHTTPAAVNADASISTKEIVALADGSLVRKL